MIKKNTLNGNNYLAFSNIIYQRQKFLRSFLEWNLKFGKRSFHINIAHTNNLEYQDLDLTSIGYGDQNFVYFPEAYHEKRNGEWGYLFETQHLFLSEINVFTKVLFNPLKKTYLKFDYDLRYFFFQSNKRERQRFHALGIGVKPKEGTLLFLEYTNQTVFFDRIPLQNKFPSDAYFALNAKQILKFRRISIFKKTSDKILIQHCSESTSRDSPDFRRGDFDFEDVFRLDFENFLPASGLGFDLVRPDSGLDALLVVRNSGVCGSA